MTEGEKRREGIIKRLSTADAPVSGTELAKEFKVSRQVIVQDGALLRAEDRGILSTYRGYVLQKNTGREGSCIRVFSVDHTTEDTLDELQTIVDCGGRVLDVSVEHRLYGQIRADLIINNRLDAAEFTEQMARCTDQPIKALTGGCHYHTVAAPSERNLDRIEEELKKKGYLMKKEERL